MRSAVDVTVGSVDEEVQANESLFVGRQVVCPYYFTNGGEAVGITSTTGKDIGYRFDMGPVL